MRTIEEISRDRENARAWIEGIGCRNWLTMTDKDKIDSAVARAKAQAAYDKANSEYSDWIKAEASKP